MRKEPRQPVDTQPANNFFARSSRGMADSCDKAAAVGADLSRLRIASVEPQGARIKHQPLFGSPNRALQAADSALHRDGVFVLCGCNYLSASFWPETIAAAHAALDTHGVGSYDSAPLSGETQHHEQVKAELRTLYRPGGQAAAFLTISASMANITTIPMLVGQGDTIFADAECHMTLMQGCMLSKATVVRFDHGDMQDLEKKLLKADLADPAREKRRLLVTDGIFSMSGHVCNLPRLDELATAYQCLLLVDEAHALGALGPKGRGTADYWNMDPACIDVVTGTLAKAVGAQGGYIVCSEALAQSASFEYTTNRVFSSGIPASIAAAAAQVLGQINAVSPATGALHATATAPVSNTFSEMYRKQRRNVGILRQYLDELPQYGIQADTDEVPGVIQRIMVGDELTLFAIQKQLYLRGVYVVGIVYPAVPRGHDQLRLTIMPTLQEEQVHVCGRAIVEVFRHAALAEQGVPKPLVLEPTGLDADLSTGERHLQLKARRFAIEVMRPMGQRLDQMTAHQAVASDSPLWSLFAAFSQLGINLTELFALPADERARLMAVAFEELGYGEGGLAVLLGAAMVPRIVLQQLGRQDLLAKYADYSLGCWAVTEPDHGTDMIDCAGQLRYPGTQHGPMNCYAKLVDERIVITGQKAAWVSNGPIAQICVLFCGFDDGSGADKRCALLVPLDAPGVTRGAPLEKMGQRAMPQGALYFDQVSLSLEHLLATPEQYAQVEESVITEANALMGVIWTGAARAAYEHAYEYAHQRKQGGVTIMQHQNVRYRLFHMFCKVEASRALARRALLFNYVAPRPALQGAIAAKITATQTAFELASQAIQMFGANGLAAAFPVEKLLRDARASMIEDGCNEVLAIKGGSLLVRN